ncbi:MAG TPA: glycosyltransferase family 1 protein [Saprospiraceae bacterium]|nr:glycosyltransferase family 1 protein [Saprospiraceae bacterium]
MILGFDAKRLFHNTSGLGNYSRTLLRDLSVYHPENSYHLFTPSMANHQWVQPFLQPPFQSHYPERKTWWWRSFTLTSSFPPDLQVYHGLSHELPFTIHQSSIKKIVTIHDLIYRHFPQDFPLPDRITYERKIQYALKTADYVVAISEHTRQDVLAHFPVSPDRVRVIHQSVLPLFRDAPSPDLVAKARRHYQLPEMYLLYVGALSHRKNALLMLQALSANRNLDIPMVIVGKGKHYEHKCRKYVSDHKLDNRVIWLGHVAPDQVPLLMKGASAVIYPSLYEGFGLPVLESIMLDVPVVTTRESALTEAGGDLAYYISGRDPGELAEVTLKAVSSNRTKDYNERKLRHLAQFDAAKVAGQWSHLYQQVIDD